MGQVLLAALLCLPIAAFGNLLARRRDWRTLSIFLALAAAVLAIALIVGYVDYRSTADVEPLISGWGMETHLTLFGALGLIFADWLAFVWGGFYWLTKRGARPPHQTRADRRRAARAGTVARPSRSMPK